MRSGATDMPLRSEFDRRFPRPVRERSKQQCSHSFNYFTHAESNCPQVTSVVEFRHLLSAFRESPWFQYNQNKRNVSDAGVLSMVKVFLRRLVSSLSTKWYKVQFRNSTCQSLRRRVMFDCQEMLS